MKYDISVIIPCYNRENTISRCIESVISQTIDFDKIELILVDDKSKDKTREIITQYAEKYENIKPIFLKENSGHAGKPRNIGIRNVTADYVMFLDSDDEYDTKICENLFNEMKQEKADIVTCNYVNIELDRYDYIKYDFINGKIFENKIIMEYDDIKNFKISNVICSIFKKSIILKNNITFPEDKIAEDLWFMIKYLLKCKKAVYLNNYHGYLRHLNRSSTMHTMDIKEQNGYWDMIEECMELYPPDYDLSYRFESYILYGYIQLLTNNLISQNPDGCYDFLKRIKATGEKINFNKKLMMPFNIINWFVMRENYKTAFFLLKTIYIYKNEFFFKLYKRISSRNQP